MIEDKYKKVDEAIAQLIDEAMRINAETRWYPLLIAFSLFSTITILVKLFL